MCVPVDSETVTWNLELNLIERLVTSKTKAIIPVHLYGHPVGDQALVTLADVLHDAFRESDTVGRLGGDEFAIVLRETGVRDATSLADRVLGRIRALRITTSNDQVLQVTVSIGLAEIQSQDDEKSCFERADQCLYAAKQAGRDRLSTAPLR